MAQKRQFRNYVYVSKGKVGRLAAALPADFLKRVAGADVKLGPLGAGIQLVKPTDPDVIALVGAVEDALKEEYGVRTIADPDLRAGHWVTGVGIEMTYGLPISRGKPNDTAAFVAVQEAQRIFLAGSAHNLLDRSVSPTEVADSMSAPDTIWALLANSTELDEGSTQSPRPEDWLTDGYPIGNIHSQLAHRSGLFPLSFLAMLTRVTMNRDKGIRNLIGTPLYVATARPW